MGIRILSKHPYIWQAPRCTLLMLLSVLMLVAASAPVRAKAQLSWELTPSARETTKPEMKEPAEDGSKLKYEDQAKSPAVLKAEQRVKRNRISLSVSTVPMLLGAILASAGALGSINQIGSSPPADTSSQDATLFAGSVMLGAGAVWMLTSGIVLGVRKRQLREVQGTSKSEQRAMRRASREQAEPASSEPEGPPSKPVRPYDKRLAR